MAKHECGDEFDEERVCDECAGILPSIRMYEWRTDEYVYVEATEAPILVDDQDTWFEVDIRFENGDEHYATYDEVNLRWESGEL